ncbi:hypothetical protein EIP86_010902 [Pleurotus ostreatoroseus]|nr:hypothetical protein EIP86_010902 [Pleurotus ostreatoroseus]
MHLLHRLTTFLLWRIALVSGTLEQDPLAFSVVSGGNDNHFLRDNVTAAQLLLTSSNNRDVTSRRLIFALPAGNSGALTYFIPSNASSDAPALDVQLINGTFRSTIHEFDNAGVQADFSFNTNATLGVTIVGSVRAMRDYVEGGGIMHEILNYTLASYNNTSVRLHRRWINSTEEDPSVFKGADLYLDIPSGSPASLHVTPANEAASSPVISIIVPSNASGVARVTFVTNETSLVGLDTNSLFLPEVNNGTQGLRTALNGLTGGKIAAGDQINIQNGQSQLGGQPWYDYKMIDTGAPNILYNFGRAEPFSREPIISNLIGLRPGQPVGNWRDSNQGLGYGFFPFDVNTALVPASLRAIESLLNAGILRELQLPMRAAEVADIARVWEDRALSFFQVSVKQSIADAYLRDFVKAANLSEALLNNTDAETSKNVEFYALSLMQDGPPVEVMHSDMSFSLVYGNNLSQDFLQRVIDALQPYPRGLLTTVGMVVANPAYDSNRTNIEVLNRAAYHGTVIWSFQQGLMANGLARQLSFCAIDNATAVDTNTPPSTSPTWCKNASFVQSLRDAQTRLWQSIDGARNEINTEVWSYSFDNIMNKFAVADLASIFPDGTEADAIQLWSFGFLGLIDPSSNKTIVS